MSLKIESGPRNFRVPKTAELLANDLRNKIIRNELPDNHPLPSESELAIHYSISRPTLREAMRILESEGLITVARGVHGGARVHKPDPRLAALHFGRVLQNRDTTLGDIFMARLLIEPVCARQVAERGGNAALKILRGLFEEHRGHSGDDARFNAIAARFHNAIIELAGNAPLILLMGALTHIFELHIATSTMGKLNQGNAMSRKAELEFEASFIECIETGDGAAAEERARDFLTRIDKLLRRTYEVDQTIEVLR